jgi:hypothetical protein
MAKIDLKNDLKHLYSPAAKKFTLVNVPPMNYLMLDGIGNPNTSRTFQDAVQVLFSFSYTLKFYIKKTQVLDYSVMPLEGLWWSDNMGDYIALNKDSWRWTLMIMQPECVTRGLVEELRPKVAEKIKDAEPLAALAAVRFEPYSDGLSAQILYTGAYADEAPVIARMHNFIIENDYQLGGKHHEIYLNDSRKTAPEKLKTVLRQPIKPKS